MEARDIILPAAALTVAATAMMAPGASAYDSKLNQTDYWGTNCRKVEMPGNVTEYTPAGESINKVIVKGGTTNKVYDKAPFSGLKAAVNPKSGKVYAISHVIVCSDDDTAAMPSQPVKHSDKKPGKTEVKTKSTSTPEPDSKPTQAHKKANKKAEQPAVVKTSSASTTGKGGVKAVMGASTDGSVQASELPKTGADDAAVAIVAAGATAYAATRALRRH